MSESGGFPVGLRARALKLSDVGEILLLSFPLERVELKTLTPAERAVVALVVGGANNRQIATARQTSLRTVENQLARVFRKLGVRSRAELLERMSRASFGDSEDAA